METEGGPTPQPGCLPVSHTGHHHLFGTAESWGGGQSPVSKGLSLSLCPSVNKCEFVELERVGLSVQGRPVGWGSQEQGGVRQALSLGSEWTPASPTQPLAGSGSDGSHKPVHSETKVGYGG